MHKTFARSGAAMFMVLSIFTVIATGLWLIIISLEKLQIAFEVSAATHDGEILTYSEEHDVGLGEAAEHLMRVSAGEAIADLMREGSLEDKVDWLLQRYAADQRMSLPKPE